MWLPHLLLLLAIYSFGPGLLLVRPFRLSPVERLACSVGVGLFLNFLLSFAIFAFGLNSALQVGVTVISLVMGALAWRDWLLLLRSHHVRRLFVCWLALLCWGMLMISCIRHYGGGTWGGDWREHYERTRFFQGGVPYDFQFINQYPLPMRPPMMNTLVASTLSQAIDYDELNTSPGYPDFEAFQIAFVFLNSLIFFPCAMLIGRVVKLPARLLRKATWTLAAVLAANAMFSQNLAYGWTKHLASFYALLAVAVYLRGIRKTPENHKGKVFSATESQPSELESNGISGRSTRTSRILDYSQTPNPRIARRLHLLVHLPLSFALLCIGFLVHFSVGPCALFLGLHYLFAVWCRRPKKWREAGRIGIISVLILSTWFAWSIVHFGAKTTFTSTSAVSDAAKMTPAQNAASIAKNLGTTLLPTVIWMPSIMGTEDLDQTMAVGYVRDYCFLIYQVSVTGGLGFIGLPLAGFLAWRAFSGRSRTNPPIRRFWLLFFPVVYVVGVVVYGGTDRFGVAHICLQPLVLVGLCLVAGGVWTLGPAWRIALAAGLLFDASLGVFLQLALEHQLFTINLQTVNGQLHYVVIPGPDVPSAGAQHNLKEKLEMNFVFWGDRFNNVLPLFQLMMAALLAGLMAKGLLPIRRPIPMASPPVNRPAVRRKR